MVPAHNRTWASLGCVFMVWAGAASGQTYPTKPLRIVTAEPGGSLDFAARLMTQPLATGLGQQIVVDNRAPLLSIETVAKASADGYTLLIAGNPLWLMPLMQNVSFDALRDFAPISLVNKAPSILVVHPSTPVNSVKEFIALAKARPGELNYASVGAGSSSHLAPELFKAMAGVNLVRIPYKGSAPALTDLITGQVQVMFPNGAAIAPYVKAGKLKALGVASLEPSPLAPGLPTIAASGLPGYESATTIGVFTVAKTPTPIISRLNQEIVRFLKTGEAKERFFATGAEVLASTPEELGATVKSDIAKFGKIIKQANIRQE